jgi:hypothetical protein
MGEIGLRTTPLPRAGRCRRLQARTQQGQRGFVGGERGIDAVGARGAQLPAQALHHGDEAGVARRVRGRQTVGRGVRKSIYTFNTPTETVAPVSLPLPPGTSGLHFFLQAVKLWPDGSGAHAQAVPCNEYAPLFWVALSPAYCVDIQ